MPPPIVACQFKAVLCYRQLRRCSLSVSHHVEVGQGAHLFPVHDVWSSLLTLGRCRCSGSGNSPYFRSKICLSGRPLHVRAERWRITWTTTSTATKGEEGGPDHRERDVDGHPAPLRHDGRLANCADETGGRSVGLELTRNDRRGRRQPRQGRFCRRSRGSTRECCRFAQEELQDRCKCFQQSNL